MTVEGIADLGPLQRAREQKAWYWYDWANSAFVTTTAAVLFSPYLTSVAEKAACGYVTDEELARPPKRVSLRRDIGGCQCSQCLCIVV